MQRRERASPSKRSRGTADELVEALSPAAEASALAKFAGNHAFTRCVQRERAGVSKKRVSRSATVVLRVPSDEQYAPREDPVARPMSDAAWLEDLGAAESHAMTYFQLFENTQSAAESGYNEAVRLFEASSRKRTSGWKQFLIEAFETVLGLLPGAKVIKEAFVRILTGAGKYAKNMESLLEFAKQTVSKYGESVLDALEARPDGKEPASMPEVFQETRRVKEREILWRDSISKGWRQAHALAASKGYPWLTYHVLKPRFEKALQPMSRIGEEDFILQYEKQLWIEYLRRDVKKAFEVAYGHGIYYFYKLDDDRLGYLRKRFGWEFFDVWSLVEHKDSAPSALERWLTDWNQVS